jgi:hypothetical protein
LLSAVVLNISRFGDGDDTVTGFRRFGVISLFHSDGGSSLFRRWLP